MGMRIGRISNGNFIRLFGCLLLFFLARSLFKAMKNDNILMARFKPLSDSKRLLKQLRWFASWDFDFYFTIIALDNLTFRSLYGEIIREIRLLFAFKVFPFHEHI